MLQSVIFLGFTVGRGSVDKHKFGRKAPIELDDKALTAFESLKQACKALISAPCYPTKQTEIWADVFGELGTVGAVLMQDH
jgi:hypothetical protein